MNDHVSSDPLIRLLADLPPIAPSVPRDRRVLSRCHAALERQVTARSRAKRARRTLTDACDVALGAAVAFYAAVAVSEALRLTLGI